MPVRLTELEDMFDRMLGKGQVGSHRSEHVGDIITL